MRCRSLIPSAIALASVLTPAIAAAQASTSFGVAAGASVPVGNFSDAVSTGYHAMATLNVSAPLAPVGFRIDGMFNEFNLKGGGSDKDRVFAVTGNVLLNTGSAIVASPYLIGGGGWYHNSLSFNDPLFGNGSSTDNQFGFNVGAGVRIPLTGFSAFIEARYHKMLGNSGVQFIPITFGINF